MLFMVKANILIALLAFFVRHKILMRYSIMVPQADLTGRGQHFGRPVHGYAVPGHHQLAHSAAAGVLRTIGEGLERGRSVPQSMLLHARQECPLP